MLCYTRHFLEGLLKLLSSLQLSYNMKYAIASFSSSFAENNEFVTMPDEAELELCILSCTYVTHIYDYWNIYHGRRVCGDIRHITTFDTALFLYNYLQSVYYIYNNLSKDIFHRCRMMNISEIDWLTSWVPQKESLPSTCIIKKIVTIYYNENQLALWFA